MENYYQLLGIGEDATEKDIKRAYRALAKEWHPDKHQGQETLAEAETKFKAISEAYSTLSDPKRKQEYDYLRSGKGTGPLGGKYYGAGTDPFSVFSEMFSGVRRAANRSVERAFPGQTVQLNLRVSLAESLFGVEKNVSLTVLNACLSCKARGALKFQTCKACGGSGSVRQVFGQMTVDTMCQLCEGTGQAPSESCSSCAGAKLVSENKNIRIQVPPQLTPGSRLRFAGAGGAGTEGMPAGDLFVQVSVERPNLENLTDEERESLRTLLAKI